MKSMSCHRSIMYVLVAMTLVLFRHGSIVYFGGYVNLSVWICSVRLGNHTLVSFMSRGKLLLSKKDVMMISMYSTSVPFHSNSLLLHQFLQSISPLTSFELHNKFVIVMP